MTGWQGIPDSFDYFIVHQSNAGNITWPTGAGQATVAAAIPNPAACPLGSLVEVFSVFPTYVDQGSNALRDAGGVIEFWDAAGVAYFAFKAQGANNAIGPQTPWRLRLNNGFGVRDTSGVPVVTAGLIVVYRTLIKP